MHANNPENLVAIVHRRQIFHAFATNDAHTPLGRIMETPKALPHDMFADDVLDALLKI